MEMRDYSLPRSLLDSYGWVTYIHTNSRTLTDPQLFGVTMKRAWLIPTACAALALYLTVTGFQCGSSEITTAKLAYSQKNLDKRSEERRVGKECRSRWSP